MATFRPYDGEGYGGLDVFEVKTLGGVDLKGRLPGDVLQEVLYAGPQGEIHPALSIGCSPQKLFSYDQDNDKIRILPINSPMPTVNEKKIRMLRAQDSTFALGADAKLVAKRDLNRYDDSPGKPQPVVDQYGVPNVPQVSQGGVVRYPGARAIVPHRTPCECKAYIERAALKYGDVYSTTYARFIRDFHSMDQRFFNDSDIITQEFYGMPNASSLALMLVRAGVIESPPFPLRILRGRTEPCACSVLGPEMVNRVYYFLYDTWEHDSIFRNDPITNNLGNLLARYNERITLYFNGEDHNRRLKQSQEERVINMAKLKGQLLGSGNPGAAGMWDYDPLPAREPGKGRLTRLVGETGGVTENKRLLAERTARKYGYVLTPGGQLLEAEEAAQ
jgi:hypothetical protein